MTYALRGGFDPSSAVWWITPALLARPRVSVSVQGRPGLLLANALARWQGSRLGDGLRVRKAGWSLRQDHLSDLAGMIFTYRGCLGMMVADRGRAASGPCPKGRLCGRCLGCHFAVCTFIENGCRTDAIYQRFLDLRLGC
jgi:hypothetical protein